ncbi:MAG: hypothetical protein AB7N76_02860 [Planctomycetota bacterium]
MNLRAVSRHVLLGLCLALVLGCERAPTAGAPAPPAPRAATPVATPVPDASPEPAPTAETPVPNAPAAAPSAPPTSTRAPTPAAPAPVESRTPAAPGPDLARFAGRWSDGRVALTLRLAPDGRLAGELGLGDRALAASAWPEGGRLEGRFRADGHELAFTLEPTEPAGSVLLRCDERAYVLARAASASTAPSAGPSSWVGRYAGSVAGSELELVQGEGGIAGTLLLERVRYELRAQPQDAGLEGSLRDPLTGRSIGFGAVRAGERLVLTLRLEAEGEERRVSYQTLSFVPAR